jgi:hypothetical protein
MSWTAIVFLAALGAQPACRGYEAPPRAHAEQAPPPARTRQRIELPLETAPLPPEANNLACLLASQHARINLQFGYRGCFGGSDNDLDLDVAAAGTLSGHLWTGLSGNQATDRVPLTRQEGQAFMRQLVEALLKPEGENRGGSSTMSFVRVSYWCGAQKVGPFMLETHTLSRHDDQALAKLMRHPPPDAGVHSRYSRVHGTIAAARAILSSAPSQHVESAEQKAAACKQRESLYQDGMRVRHDPVESWHDPD